MIKPTFKRTLAISTVAALLLAPLIIGLLLVLLACGGAAQIPKPCATERAALIRLRDRMRLTPDPTPQEIHGWIAIANDALGVPTNKELKP